MIRYLLPSFLLLLSIITNAQTWTGKVVDKKGEALPFINVYFEGTSVGTTTNLSGEFSLNQPAGKYSLMFQFVGFERKKIDLNGRNADQALKVVLTEQVNQINEVTIASYKKDPAYYIIKQAQKKRKYYLNQVESFACKVYMKGSTRFVGKPDSLPGIAKLYLGKKKEKEVEKELDSAKLGLLYLQEAMSNVYYDKKQGFKEEQLASKVSGSSKGISWNRAQEVLVDFYDDRLHMMMMNERGCISPIASDAMLFYDYKLLGTFTEDGHLVNKIQVIPKRKSDPVFHGTIYIIEDLWNIHSLNLVVAKEAQIEFVDSILINQSFSRIEKDIFRPLSIQSTYSFSIFGFKADYQVVGNISDYEIGKVYQKNFFKNEIYAVKDSANIQDSTFWNKARPVNLSEDEVENIRVGDSIKYVHESKAYMDSIDSLGNHVRIGRLFTTGYSHYNRYDSLRYDINGIANGLQFTSVDGVVLQLSPSVERETAKGRITNSAGLRYGFASNRPGLKLRHEQLFNRINHYTHFIEGGYFTNQINESEPIGPFLNSLYTLIDGKNYAQFYQKLYLKAGASGEVVNGITMSASAEYAHRQNVNNETTYNFNGRKLLNPGNFNAGFSGSEEPFNTFNAGGVFKFDVAARITFKQKYASYPNRKVNSGSKYPKLRLAYQFGSATSSDPAQSGNWNLVQAEIYDMMSFGMIGTGEYSLSAGTFLGDKPTNFVDYKHFNGNQTAVINERRNAFQILPYYDFSTNGTFVEAHYEHHFYGFILNKIPLIKKLKWKENAGVNFLYTQNGKEYTEVYAGIENVFRIFKIQFVSYYKHGEPLKPALRIGFRI